MWILRNGKWEWVFCAPENEGGNGSGEGGEGDDDQDPDDQQDDEGTGDDQDPDDQQDDEGTGDDQDPDDVEDQKPKKSRGQNRHQALANENQRLREEQIRLEERLRLQDQNRNNSHNNDAMLARAEKLAAMTPEQRENFLIKEELDRVKEHQQLGSIQMQDIRDEANYNAIASLNNEKGRLYMKHKEAVEKALATQRSQGRNPSREALLRIILGDQVLNAKPSKRRQQQKAEARQRVEQARGTPSTTRGGPSGGSKGGDDLKALEARILAREKAGDI